MKKILIILCLLSLSFAAFNPAIHLILMNASLNNVRMLNNSHHAQDFPLTKNIEVTKNVQIKNQGGK